MRLARHALTLSVAALFVHTALAQAPVVDEAPCEAAATPEQTSEALVLYRQGQQRLQQDEWPEAEAAFRAALRLDPRLALAGYGLGESLLGLKRFPEAVQAFRACRESFRCPAQREQLERERDREITELRDTLRQLERQRLVERLVQWREVNREQPSVGAQMRLAEALDRRLAELEHWRRRADPVPPGVTVALGTAHFLAGQLEDAEHELRAAVAADPRSGDAHNNFAVVLLASGRIEEAEREARLAEKAGVKPNPKLKAAIKARRKSKP